MVTVGPLARGLALACHPGPTLVVSGLAAGLAWGIGSTPAMTALLTAAVLAGQLSVGWSNDWIDASRDSAVDRGSKPVVAGLVTARTLRAAAVGALVVCVPLSLAVGWLPGGAHLAAVASAWAYNARLKSTVVSWLPYAVSFGLLLQFVVLAQPGGSAGAWWATLAAALLGVGAHVANVLPDLEHDRLTGVRGLPHRLGYAGSTVAALTALLGAVAAVVLGPGGRPDAIALVGGGVAAVLAGAGAVTGVRHRRSAVPFAASMAVAAVCVVLLVHAGAALAQGTAPPVGP